MQTISILGSTGSIGTQSLEVAKKHNIRIKALAAHSNAKLLAEQVRQTGAEYACIYNEEKLPELEEALNGCDTKLLTGMEGLKEIAALDGVDKLLNSVVGMVGLEPTLTAIEAGVDIALANKETLVAGGELVMKRAAEKGVHIYPVDSEHSAIFQCLQGNKAEQVRGIILTASGGPFYGKTKDDLKDVTVEQALNHPNWSMGSKITIDSSTLMNKGLEFIEAMRLFDLRPEQIEIVVHRQSVVHSAVCYNDSSVIAQMGVPDMKIPIQYALLYPDRFECPTKPLSLTDYGTL
ncbi:MAG: 1-deoxy-D-xylulose-5-phosphate reductoisomerase, partial [Ruminococcus sp.]|nr:1-deoxy-D-xylulose-5-phosphate reductoisomerase [Ruminococcus sp.]